MRMRLAISWDPWGSDDDGMMLSLLSCLVGQRHSRKLLKSAAALEI